MFGRNKKSKFSEIPQKIMPVIENFGKENYEQLKLFLITHFNIRFLEDSNPDIEEHFEITTPEGILSGSFLSNQSFGITCENSTEHHFEKIMTKVKEIKPDSKPITKKFHPRMEEYFENSKLFFDHISNCSECKKKFSEIWNHMK